MTTPPHDGPGPDPADPDSDPAPADPDPADPADPDPADDEPDDEPLARPFLAGATAPADDGRTHDGDPDDGDPDDGGYGGAVRPYVITSGRTPSGPPIALEALVRTTERGETAPATHEAARILDLCRQAQSIAEVSAHLGVPVGVTRVLVADLNAAELLTIGARPTTQELAADPEFLERLMLGVAEL